MQFWACQRCRQRPVPNQPHLTLIVRPHIDYRNGCRFHLDRFDVRLNGQLILTSRQPWYDAARELLRRGYPGDTLLTVRHSPISFRCSKFPPPSRSDRRAGPAPPVGAHRRPSDGARVRALLPLALPAEGVGGGAAAGRHRRDLSNGVCPGNHKSSFNGVDEAIRRRVLLVPSVWKAGCV